MPAHKQEGKTARHPFGSLKSMAQNRHSIPSEAGNDPSSPGLAWRDGAGADVLDLHRHPLERGNGLRCAVVPAIAAANEPAPRPGAASATFRQEFDQRPKPKC